MAVDEDREHPEPIVRAIRHEILVVEPDRATALDDRRRRSTYGGDPVRQLVDVADRRREADEANVLWKVDHHLLPDRAPIGILEEVHFVEHDETEVVQEPRAAVDHVAQDLGGHHDDGGVTVDRVVPGQQAHVVLAVHGDEVTELLVRERLDRRRVERPLPREASEVDAVLRHDGLAAPGRHRNDHVLATIERIERIDLESIDAERVLRDECLPIGPTGDAVAGHSSTGRRRTTSHPTRIAMKYRIIIGTPSNASVIGSPEGVMTAAIDCDRHEGESPTLQQSLGSDGADQLEADDEDGQQEPEAEREDHQPDQADVAADREDLVDVRTRPGDQELECLPNGEIGECAARCEQHDRHQDERNCVLLLLRVQRRHGEAPGLPEQDRQREDDSAVHTDAHPGRNALRRAEVVQGGVAEVLRFARAQVDVRFAQEVQDLVVERDDQDHADRDGQRTADDPDSEFTEVLRQRHGVRGCDLVFVGTHQDAGPLCSASDSPGTEPLAGGGAPADGAEAAEGSTRR